MASEWCVVVLDPTAGGAEQLVRQYWDASQSAFQPIAHYRPEASNWQLRFDSTISLNIREGFPWMAGYRDTATRYWDKTQPLYCGQISQQTGSGKGRDHILVDLLDDWSVSFGDIGIIHWPNNDFVSFYPSNWSIWDWMVGRVDQGRPFDGFLQPPMFDNTRIDLETGISDIFKTLIIDDTYMPTIGKAALNEDYYGGVAQFCTIKDAIDTMITVARFISEGINPVAFIEAVVDPHDATRIIPRFRMIDTNDMSAEIDAVYSIDPGPGEYGIEQPAEHNRDLRPAKGRIVVVGKGGDATLPGNPLVFVDYYNPEHSDQYPAWLNATPGRVLFIIDDRIETILAASKIAHATEPLVYGPAGRITFISRRYTVPGRVVKIFWPQEGQVNTLFVVSGVKAIPNPGSPKYEITIGQPARDLRFIIDRAVTSGLNDIPINLTQVMAPGLGAPTTPKNARQPVDSRPHTTAQATITPRDKTVVGSKVKGTNTLKRGADPMTTAAANLAEWEAAGVGGAKTNVSADGRPHPNSMHLGALSVDANYPITVAVYKMLITAVDLAGTGSVVINKNGVAVTGTITGDGHHTFTGVVLNPSAAPGSPGDRLSLTLTGSDPLDPLYIVVWEA